MNPLELGRLAAWALAGFAAGTASFAALRLTTDAYVRGARLKPIALHAARLALLGAGLLAAAHAGAWPLLAAAAGLTAARPLAVRLWGRAP
jgi:hypothetical protein